ncbi:MAG TPA: ABC transporter substrate-binding protein [Acidimicrobiales bacterium]|nr:ABC transporter substrate-binding protein [Acidimicrobiales bacterium]
MAGLTRRAVAVALAVALMGACGNSPGDDAGSDEPEGEEAASAAPAGEGDRDAVVEISGVPGVSDDEISFAVIGTKAGNPLGTCILDCYVEGIEAYFAFRNAEGGIYGRELVIGEILDDELNQNQVRALDVISGERSFGVFQATLLATGWGDLDSAGIPTYTWGIHATEAADRPHIFPSITIRCPDCTGRLVPYAAMEAGATTAASIGYGVSENSKVCTNGVAESLDMYSGETGVEVAYVNDDLDYGLSNGIGPEVTAMKDAGVDFISTCIDLNGMKTLAQELDRQGMGNVVMYHPNTYNQQFVAEAGDLFEGDFVSVQFLPFEAEDEGTALADYLEWMEAQGSEPSELAMIGWINASLAFEGLLAAGPDFDRDKVTAATNALSEFTAGGLIEPIDWTQAHTPYTQQTRDVDTGKECGVLVRVEGGEFVTVGPAEEPWLCWDQSDTAWADPEPTSFG